MLLLIVPLLQGWAWWPPLPGDVQRYERQEFSDDWKQGYHVKDNFKPDDNKSPVAYGGIINNFTVLPTSSPAVLQAVTYALPNASAADSTITSARKLVLSYSGDGGQTSVVEKLSYRGHDGRSHRFDGDLTMGVNFYLTVETPSPGGGTRTHNLVVLLDTDMRHQTVQHTFTDSDVTPSVASEGEKPALPILCYNIWNTNPPTWAVRDANRRSSWYNTRMDHFASVVRSAGAPIVGLQEVRFDTTTNDLGDHSQVSHLTRRLPEYTQFVFQPAMLYYDHDAGNPLTRVEEGPMIMSKFPIVHTDHAILSHDPQDKDDVHQRVCLHAVVDVPDWGLVDVYTAHLSLSEPAREKTLIEIYEFVRDNSRGVMQLFMGDLNAEPDSKGIQYIQGLREMNGSKTDFVDTWLELHPEPTPRSNNTDEIENMLTFPTCNPVKRIDFILMRRLEASKAVKVIESKVVGKTGAPGTELYEGAGMLDVEPPSPIFASDHKGVLTTLAWP
jgi:endonuclease/exonuclease/phosphatase family metal-dependent hydrolase